MLGFTDFGFDDVNFLFEELNDYQKKYIQKNYYNMSWEARNAHEKVFGDKDRIIEPYRDDEQTKITTDNYHHNFTQNSMAQSIIRFMNYGGHKTDDYASGLAYHQNDPNRKIRISKILPDEPSGFKNKDGKDMTWKQAYAADPFRQAGKGEKQIVYTIPKAGTAGVEDVAKCSSTGSWGSCMTLPKEKNDPSAGTYHRKVFEDLHQGTIVAWVTKKGDDEVKNPLGRISLKAFDGEDNHRIYVPESSSYGSIPNSAKKQVLNFSERNYPRKPGIYIKHPSLYDDDGKSFIFHDMHKMHDGATDVIYNSFNNRLHKINRAGQDMDNIPSNGDFDNDPYSHHDKMIGATSAFVESLPDHEQTKLKHHILTLNAADNDTKTYENLYDESKHDLESEHYLSHYAHNNPIEKNDLHGFVPSELMAMHVKANSAVANLDDPDEHQELKKSHAHIINKMFSFGDSANEYKNQMLHDFVDDKTHPYYENLFDEHHIVLDNEYPHMLTKNPRTMHTLLNQEDKQDFVYGKGNDNFNDSEYALHHIGKHADQDLIDDVLHGHLSHIFNDGSDVDHLQHIVHGLNENPEGEKLQHHLISGLHLTDGENGSQDKILKTRIPKNNRPIYPESSDYVDSSGDYNRNNIYDAIAEHTEFPSVHQALKTRHDTSSDPELMGKLARNVNF